MKFKNNVNFTYKGYLHDVCYSNEAADEAEILSMLQKFRHIPGLMQQAVPVFFVIDYTKKEYLLCTQAIKAIAGYDAREFIESGLNKLIDVYQKDDFKVYNEKIFPFNLEFLEKTPQAEHGQYVFSYNFRIRNRDKTFSTLLQRGSYITSEANGLPLYSLGTIMDVTAFRQENTFIHHSIEKTGNGSLPGKSLVVSNHFSIYEELLQLSRKEREVLLYMAEGLSSKMLADKLKISINTVSNHRQNMLKKTNTQNTAQLIAFAAKNGLI